MIKGLLKIDFNFQNTIYGGLKYHISNKEELYKHVNNIDIIDYLNMRYDDYEINKIYCSRMKSIIRQDKIEKILR